MVLKKRTFEFRSLRTAEQEIKKLIQKTSSQPNPELFISVGRFSENAEHVLAMANACKCKLNINAILGPDVFEGVLKILKENPNYKIIKVIKHKNGHMPNYLFSDSGFYLQNGLKFDDAIVSFEKDGINDFLNSVYLQTLGEAA